jgi:hypothetical protein
MSLDNVNREPSPCRMGEGCHVPLSNSCPSRGEAVPRPAVQGGDPAKAVRAAGAVGVLRSSGDLPESITGGERRRGTWVRVKGTRNGTGDGQGDLDINSAKVSGAARFTVTAGASPAVEAPSESRMRENRPSGLMRGGVRRSLALGLFNPSAPPTLLNHTAVHSRSNPKSGCRRWWRTIMTRMAATLTSYRK